MQQLSKSKTIKPLNIGFVIDDSLDKPDGVQQYVLALGKWLSERGHAVKYLAGHTTRTDMSGIFSFGRIIKVKFNQNIVGTPLPVNKSKIRKFLYRENFDVLHVQMPYSPFFGAKTVLAAPETTSIIGTFHITPYSRIERVATKLLGIALKKSLKRFSAFISVSSPAAVFAHEAFGIETHVLPNVVDVAYFSNGKPRKAFRLGKTNIVFLGRLVERKGCLELLKAIDHLNRTKRLTDVQVYIGGRGPQLSILQEYVAKNGLTKHVTFLGFIDEADKPDLLASADIAVFPSTGGESFGIVLLEAMAAGAGVVLGGNNPGYASVLQDSPNQLFDPKNTKRFADTLASYIQNAEKRKSAHKWQMKNVMQYDVNYVGLQLEEVYHQIVAKNARAHDNSY